MLKKLENTPTKWLLTLVFTLIIITLALIFGLIFKNLSYVLAQTAETAFTDYSANTNASTSSSVLQPKIIIESPETGPISGFVVISFKVTNNENGAVRNLDAYCGSIYLRSIDVSYSEKAVASWNAFKLPDGPCNFYLKNNLIRSVDVALEIENRQDLGTTASSTTEVDDKKATSTTKADTTVASTTANNDRVNNKPTSTEVTGKFSAKPNEPAKAPKEATIPTVVKNEIVGTVSGSKTTTASESQATIAPAGASITDNGNAGISLGTLTNVEWIIDETQLATIDEPTISGEIKKDIYQVTSVETITPPIPATSPEIITPLLKINGKATPNSYVVLYIYSKPIVVIVKTDASGNWTYLLDKPLPNGQHEVYVASTNTAGEIISKSEPFTFFIKEAQAVTAEEYNGAVNITDPFKKTENFLKKQITFFSVLVVLLIGLIVLFYILKNRHKSDNQ